MGFLLVRANRTSAGCRFIRHISTGSIAGLRRRIFLEHGYGSDFGATDDGLAELVGGIRTREQLIAECDVILLPKVQSDDLIEFRTGQIVWGWPHCVQDFAMTQIAIDSRMTLVAFEAMNHWQSDGGFGLHVFHKNNELAGYCSVLHAMQLAGSPAATAAACALRSSGSARPPAAPSLH